MVIRCLTLNTEFWVIETVYKGGLRYIISNILIL